MKKHTFLVFFLAFSHNYLQSQSLLLWNDITPSFGYEFKNSSIEMDTAISDGKNGEMQTWDFSNIPMEFSGITIKIIDPKNSPFKESKHTYLVEFKDPSDNTLVYEFYDKYGSSIQLQGFGLASADGETSEEQYEKPFTIFRFPWEIHSGFEDDNSLRLSIRRYIGYGTLKLPFGIFNHARKFMEEFNDNGSIIQEYTWYIDTIPHPVLIITNKFLNDLSSLERQTIQVNKPKNIETSVVEIATNSLATFCGNTIFLHNDYNVKMSIEVYSILGNLIQDFPLRYINSNSEIDISSLPNTAYFLKLNYNNTSTIFPFIK